MDDGQGGDFTTILGEGDNITAVTSHTVTGLTKGLTYKFKVRVANRIGFSAWSAETSIQAALKPAKPLPPLLVSADATNINL